MENTSNNVVEINSDTEKNDSNSEKPIIKLFKSLVTNDSKQNTVLTNAQIIDILNKEFDIKLSELHELEGEIYLTIMKKYLKDWPQWDEFDTIINNLKSKNKMEEMENIFESKYISLKSYLKTMLDIAENLAKPTIQAFINKQQMKEKDKTGTPESVVVLEIQASRNQLNQLIFRHPNAKLENTIFNPEFLLPTQIQLTTFPIEAILNWWGVSITIISNTNVSIYKREMQHELKHVLVNKKLKEHSNPFKFLDQDIKVASFKRTQIIEIDELIKKIDMKAKCSKDYEIYNFIKKDLKMLPSTIPSRMTLKRYTNKYPYVRYLYKEDESELASELSSNKFDLQLEETISPCYHINVVPIKDEMNMNLTINCEPCSLQFTGLNLIVDLKAHFDAEHFNEPDWKCINCNKTFSMVNLAKNWWCHRC
ncbi:unnamed protein product [Euphydryas editha]|nr:unnamed protein product [Euphydryas editha]